MFRMTTLKISLFSAFATLFLLIAMLASSGTASAHTTSSRATASAPRLSAYNIMRISGNCEGMTVSGFRFVPGSVTLSATQNGSPLTVSPNVFTANDFDADLDFTSYVTICGIDFGLPLAKVTLIGTGSNGVQSNQIVLVLS